MRLLILAIPALALSACTTLPDGSTGTLSPAMRTTFAVHQQEFRGYKPGNAELKARLKESGKYAGPDEVQEVIDGKRPGWVVADIRKDSQYRGGHIVSGGKNLVHAGREQPTTILEQELMSVRDGKEIVGKAPENVIIMCRSGMKSAFEYAAYATAGFKDVKIAGILDWAKSCRPLASSSKIKDAGLAGKGVNLVKRKDGLYYWDQCGRGGAG